MLRAGVRVRTAPWSPTLPWQAVWRQKDGIRVHLGRIYDTTATDGEYVQNRFPRKKPVLMTSIGGQVSVAPNDTSMSRNRGNGIFTGSAIVYYRSQFGRSTISDTDLTEASSDLGYVFWPEGVYKSQTEAVYVVIAREDDGNDVKWIMSLVDESDLNYLDIKIACITGSSCVQIWQSDIVYTPPATDADHPFKCVVVGNKVKVTEGTVTNVLATAVGGGDLTDSANHLTIPSTTNWFVQLKITSTNTQFPVTVEVETTSAGGVNTTTVAYVLLARGRNIVFEGQTYPIIVSQFVSTSLWGDKALFVDFANYYFYRV
jgi:hypothetical protein